MTETTFEQPEPSERRPFDRSVWEALGFPVAEAREWWERRFDPDAALRWRKADVNSLDAVRWGIAGIGPDTVRGWRDAKIDAAEAVAWRELGFSLDQARVQKRAGRTPAKAYNEQAASGQAPGQPRHPMHDFIHKVGPNNARVAHSYFHAQWMDDEAVQWAKADVEAGAAKEWKELGLGPDEAGALARNGLTPLRAARPWWEAGIPFSEVAAWIGAGFTPEEAAKQRANGADVERARVLRALRDPHDDD